ncbi:restriction endonuclease subunit S [Enterococcus faecium]|uniref:restriction endonuclease subunit S n=1 Tax=Enterococcus faecium TaxID=1352 RepID=UPI003978A2BE
MSNDTQPEIRFPGFTEAWEQRKLADLAEYYDGTHQTPKYTKSGVPFVSVENINNIKRTDKYISEEDFENQFKIKPQKDDILMTRITAGVIGDTTIVPDNNPLAYYVSLALIRPKKIMASYLEKYIGSNQFKEELHKRIIHTAFPKKINLGEIGQCIVSCPCNDSEQEKIGSFFKQLDKTITLHQRKLDLLKETKKGFLQKMFPKNGAKVPEIRFPGFTEDWEERRLQEVVDRYDNLRIPITASKRVAGNTPYYGANGIQGYVEGYTHDGEFILVAEDGANDLKNYPVQYVDGKVWVNNHAHVIQAKENLADNMFLMNAIRSINIEPFLVGGGRAKLNADVLMKLEVIIPLKSEQQKIGAFFKQLDDTIALHQRELDVLKETKKGFLQKMFV